MISTFPPRRCGVGDYTVDLSLTLAKVGVKVEIITYPESSAPVHQEWDEGVKVHRVLAGALEEKCRRMIKEIGPDIVHLHSTSGLHKRFLYRFVDLKAKSLPLVVTAHDIPLSASLFLIRRSLKKVYREAKRIFVHTTHIKKALMEHYNIKEENVVIIPHGVDVHNFKPHRLSEEHDNKRTDGVILFFGFLQPGKGIEYLIKAMPYILKEAPHAKLIIAGGRPTDSKRYILYLRSESDYINRLRRMVPESLSKHIAFTGYVDPEEVPKCFALADVVVFPYLWCTQSGALHKALACGKAIVTTPVGGNLEVIKDGRNGILVPPKDPLAITKAVVRLLKDGNLRAELGKQARMTAEKFSWEYVAQGTLNVYDQLVSQ